MASHCVGFTFPGMIELPGSFEGIISSPIPDRGPDAIIRISLAILFRETAICFNAEWEPTTASWAAKASNLFGADIKGNSVNFEI